MKRFLIGLFCALGISAWALADSGFIAPILIPATTCTNQFIRSIAAATGIGTCATVQNADLANSAVSLFGISTSLGGSYAPVKSSATVTSPSATTSASLVMMGLKGTITPATTGTIIFNAYTSFQSTIVGDGCVFSLRIGTGAAPNNGDAASGTQVNPIDGAITAGAISQAVQGYLAGYITGRTVSTAYWYDFAFASTTGGTCTPSRAAIVAIEQ